jgi:hypothetical protein
VGLLTEEYDAKHERLAGNFTQASSHLRLLPAARSLEVPRGHAPCGVTERAALGNHRPRPFRLRSAQPVRKLRQRVDLEGRRLEVVGER